MKVIMLEKQKDKMPKIDPTKLTKEIKNKYSVVSNAFRLSGGKKEKVKDGKPKDLIITEVGDVKQEEFYPQVKIGRWGDDDNTNEVNFSVRLIDGENGEETIATESNKIKWSKGNKTARFYEIEPNDDYQEGAFEFDIELAKKPKTNKIGFSLNIKGVDFYYQPPLTQEYQNGYSEEFKKEIIVTETDVKDLDGNVLVHRPDNVVGSYVPYASEQKTNWKDGKEYKVGKVGHIYRPEIFDATGASVWGILSVDKEAGKLTVEIPQDFLDKAVYPVVVDPTFGYTTQGSSETFTVVSYCEIACSSTPVESGSISSISAFIGSYSGKSANARATIRSDNSNYPYEMLAYSDEFQITGLSLRTANVSYSFLSSTKYWLTLYSTSGGHRQYYDSGDANQTYRFNTEGEYGGITENYPSSATAYARKLTIYATYTAGGGETTRTPRQGFINLSTMSVC